MTYSFDKIVFPIFARNKSNGVLRYLRSATMLDNNNKEIISCKHVLEGVDDNENLILNIYNTQSFYDLYDLKISEKFDIAVAKIRSSSVVECYYNLKEALASPRQIDMGYDVMSCGTSTPDAPA